MSGESQSVEMAQLMRDSGVGFGTSGTRGQVAAMTDRVCYAYAAAFLQYVTARWGQPRGLALGGDLRPSTPRIMSAVAAAARDAGCRVINCGFLPSPAVAFYGTQQGMASVMVTGSHIPDDRNGIKFNTALGEILKEDEQGMRAQRVALPANRFDADDCLAKSDTLPPIDRSAARAYRARYLDFFPDGWLRGLRVGVYQHSSVARDLLGEILRGLGAEAIPLGRSDRFIPVDTEAVRAEDMELARQWTPIHRLDALVSTDGDADRPLVADEQGRWLRGDVAGILCARSLGADRVVTPVSSNSAVEKCGWFLSVRRTRIGSPYVIEGMAEEVAGGGRCVVGYEANGGFLTASPVKADGRTLSPLPTRDAVIVVLALLGDARARRVPVSALLDQLPPRFTASDRLKEFPTELSRSRIQDLCSQDPANNKRAVESAFGGLFGPVDDMDTTDGLRITFQSGEIVHLRPSGNAPELRCYAEADSDVRAREITHACLGILERWRQG